MKLNKGFTLIELLVVIAIIAILAALIFPVYARVKDSAYRSSDMSNMNAIRTALQLYRTDQGGYPPQILGYATGYSNFAPSSADVVPANLVANASPWTQNSAFLYPKRIISFTVLQPAYDRVTNTITSQAVWPIGTPPPTGNQAMGPQNTVERCADIVQPGEADNGPTLVDDYFYNVDGYDVGNVRVPGGPASVTRNELRYTLFWSQYTVPTSCNPPTFDSPTPSVAGSASDDPRQLGYSDPPETTVITWDSFFRDYDSNGIPTRSGKRDIVLFLGGSAKPMDSLDVSQQGWQIKP
jgi:prepilin-type N-terminal cleavage/methylation domain-containing protein